MTESNKDTRPYDFSYSKQRIYFETLNITSFSRAVINENSFRGNCFFYIDASRFFVNFFIPVLTYLKISVTKLDFELMDFRDDVTNELIRERLVRKDLFEFEEKIKNTHEIKEVMNLEGAMPEFILKGIVDYGIAEKSSISRMIYLIEVINSKNIESSIKGTNFYINNRPWMDTFSSIASKYQIKLITVPYLRCKFILQEFSSLYLLMKYGLGLISKRILISKKDNLYLAGRGDINFQQNGHHTDYFWHLNSSFPSSNIISKPFDKSQIKILYENNTCYPSSRLKLKGLLKRSVIYRSSKKNIESKTINRLSNRYRSIKSFWQNSFEENKVKIFLSWNKYDTTHIAISEAIKEIGGVSCIWQVAYDGLRAIQCRIKSDVSFIYSKLSSEQELQNHSSSAYQVITGYTKTYSKLLLKDQAKINRQKILSNGAEKIIASFDENNGNDLRWHTGSKLQQDNYIKLIDELHKDPKLGLIFKPKHGPTLRKRLGEDVYEYLNTAISTGRCLVLKESYSSKSFMTSSPPMLAALSADLCIHGHFGTASIECALAGRPTLLIDRECMPFHNFYKFLEKDEVIFQDWDSAINASKEYFKSNNQITKFGNWSNMLVELDPFQDDKGAARMGEYLENIREAFSSGKDRNQALQISAERYKKQWGEDKVITS